jgi:hypothetical protein
MNVIKREQQIRRDDAFPDVSNSLMRVDETILGYIINKIMPTVTDNGTKIKVPTMFASPERWKSARKDGFLRDQNGKIQKPIFIIRRTTFSKNESLMTLNRYLDYTYKQTYTKKNAYDQFSILNKSRIEAPTQEIYNITLPDHVIINYEGIVWTDGVEQNNEVIEKINFATDDYWGEENRYKYRTEISDFSTQVETPEDQERVVKTTFSLTVYAHLLPAQFENGKNTVKKEFAPRKIVMVESVDTQPKKKSPAQDNIFINPNKNRKGSYIGVSVPKFIETSAINLTGYRTGVTDLPRIGQSIIGVDFRIQ